MSDTLPLAWSLVESLDAVPDARAAESVFASREWLQATRAALPFELRVAEGRESGGASPGKLRCYLPLHIIRRAGLSRAFTPILNYYGGPYHFLPADARFHERTKVRYDAEASLLRFLMESFHHVSLTPLACDPRAAADLGWTLAPKATVVARLDSPAVPELPGDVVRNANKARKAGLRLDVSHDDDGFARAFARTFARKGLGMAWKPEWAVAMRRALTAAGLMENHAIVDAQGTEIAFASVALDLARRSAVLWYSCSLPQADKTGAMHFLLQSLIGLYRGRAGSGQSAESGESAGAFATFDLCGADQRGLAEFKEKFAQALELRYALDKYRGPAVKIMMKAFTQARRLAG